MGVSMGTTKVYPINQLISMNNAPVSGGQSGIRTHETVSRPHAFQACAFSHSATCPHEAGATIASCSFPANVGRTSGSLSCRVSGDVVPNFPEIRFPGSSLYGWFIIRMNVPPHAALSLLAKREAHPRDSQAS